MASPNDPDKKAVDMAQVVKNMKENMVALLDYEVLRAQVARKRFLCLINEGFSEDQAINIVKGSY